MGWFGSGVSYKKVIEEIAVEAFHTNPMDAPGLKDPPEELGGYQFNTLEGLAAVYFLVERSFSSIADPTTREKAKEHLARLLFEDMEDTYSPSEMKTLVLPLLDRRLSQYYALLDGHGKPGDNIVWLGSAMIGNFVAEEIEADRKARAIAHLF